MTELTHKNFPGTNIPEVPPELFLKKPSDSVFLQAKNDRRLKKIIDESKGEKGHEITDDGYLTWHLSFPYPEKGVRDDYMMMSIQFVKRMLLLWIKVFTYALTHFYSPIRILEKFLWGFTNYAGMVDEYGKHFILEPRYYTPRGRELIKFISSFLKYLGVSTLIADESALDFVALVDNDTAYYYKIGDILGEADKQRMIKNPAKEIKLLMETYAERELTRPHMTEKFRSFYRPLYFALFIPRVRRAFRRAVEEMDFSKLPLDKADSYHVRHNPTYKYFGMTLAERIKAGLAEYPPTQHTLIELKWNEKI